MVITDPAEASTWLLGLGSKLYPGNEPSMLNRDLTRFMQTHSETEQAKERFCWQGVRPVARMSNENADVPKTFLQHRSCIIQNSCKKIYTFKAVTQSQRLRISPGCYEHDP